MTTAGTIPFIRAEGDPFAIGHQHGTARAEALHAFLDDGLCRLDRILPAPVTMESIRPMLAAYAAEIAAATPALAEEIRGLAEGADIDHDQALLLQLRREIMGYSRIPTMGDCTTYARPSTTTRPGATAYPSTTARPGATAPGATADVGTATGTIAHPGATADDGTTADGGATARSGATATIGATAHPDATAHDGTDGGATAYPGATAGPGTTAPLGGGGGAVLAQTVDLNGDLDDQLAVLEVALAGSSRRALVLSFGGLLGYLGCNSDGLAVGLNLVLGGDWRPGLPPYLAIRHLLDTASSVGEATRILRGLRLASSRSLMLCDSTTTACVEILGDKMRVVEQHESVHTNHFLDPDLVAGDELNVFARNSSVLRLKACRAGLATLPPDATAEDHFAMLSVPPICVADTGDIRRERTVAAVVMVPDRGELHVRPGDPSRSTTQTFRL